MTAMPQEQPNRLLIVDDDPELLRFLLEEFSSETMECIAANCGADALMNLRQSSFDLVLLDWTLPDFEGIEICRRDQISFDYLVWKHKIHRRKLPFSKRPIKKFAHSGNTSNRTVR